MQTIQYLSTKHHLVVLIDIDGFIGIYLTLGISSKLMWRFEGRKKMEAYCNMSILKLFPVAMALTLAGCTYPSNFANDITHMGDPTYDNCRRNADVYSDYGAQCAKETDPNVKAAKAEQISQLAERNRLAAGVAQQNLAARQSAELNKGYSPITVKDFVLDGKELAARKAMRSLTGVYVPNGNLELLFGTDLDANLFSFGQKTNSPTVNLLTENASRKFRSQLLACRNLPASFGGCHVHVLGSATTCVLSGPFGNRRDVPCVSVDDGSVINSSQIFGTDLNAETKPVKREDIKNADALISSINGPSLEALATKEAKIGQASKKESKLIEDKVIYFNCIPNYDFFIYNGNVIHSKYLASIYKSGDDVEFVKRIESLKEDEHSSPYIKNHNTITWIDRDVKSEFHFDTKKLYIQYIPQDPAIQYSESVLKVNTSDCEIKSAKKVGNENVSASESVNQESINTALTATQNKFINVINKYANSFLVAKNQIQESVQRDQRKLEFSNLLSWYYINDWVGTIKYISTDSNGDGSLKVDIESNVTLLSSSYIKKGSQLYNVLFNLIHKQKIKFSGSFVPSEKDYFKEDSITIRGSMTAPDFEFEFESIAPIN